MVDYQFVSVDRVDCDLIETPWSFAKDNAAAIEAHWKKRLKQTPELFNGKILLLARSEIVPSAEGSVLRGAFTPADFKTFLAWREFGSPATELRNCFSMAALESGDGAFILGEMAPHTAPAGQIYFPSGTPDLHDVKNGKVDIDGSAHRELREETGLTDAQVVFDPGLTVVMSATRVCCMKRVRSDRPAEAVVAQIHAFLAEDRQPELARMHIVRSVADLTPAMPPFVTAYIKRALNGR